jgi:DNA-binding beta-propeller fold protein YncE
MDQMVTVGTDLFVSLQLLDDAKGLVPKGPGLVAVIDTATDTVKQTIPLAFANPFAQTKGLVWDEFQQRIFVGGPGKTGAKVDDGGIQSIDPATMTASALLLGGADIQANIYDFVVAGSRRVFAIIADEQSNSVVDIDLGDRSVHKVLLSSTALITDIEMTELGELWVAYRGEKQDDPPGLRIFNVATDKETTTSAIDLGQAPFTLAFFD